MSVLQTRKFTTVSDQKVLIQDITNMLVDVPAATTLEVRITLENSPISQLTTDFVPKLTFADVNPDTIVREKGSWIADGFRAGHEIAIVNTISNDGAYVVASVSELTLTLTGGGALADEVVEEGSTVTIDGSIPDAEWYVGDTVAGAAVLEKIYEYGPTALWFFRTVGAGASTVFIKS